MDAFHPGALLNAVVYASLGIAIFMLAFVLIDRFTPFHLWREIIEHKNHALAILLGAMSIGICIIIAMAIR